MDNCLILTDQSISTGSVKVDDECSLNELPQTTCLLISSYIEGSGMLEEYGCASVMA